MAADKRMFRIVPSVRQKYSRANIEATFSTFRQGTREGAFFYGDLNASQF